MEGTHNVCYWKKGRKVNKVFDAMSDIHDMQEFKNKFKEMYPDDWNKIISTYNKEERKDTKKKGILCQNQKSI